MTLHTLRDKLKAATKPSRDLDNTIWETLGAVPCEWDPGDGDAYYWWELRDERVEQANVTDSVDSALWLKERVLPGWAYCLQRISGVEGRAPTKDCECDIWLPAQLSEKYPKMKHRFRCDADTPALALCLAIVEALIQQETEK